MLFKPQEQESEIVTVEKETEQVEVDVEVKKTLNLSNKGLLQVPENIFNSNEIELLDVSKNYLTGSLQAEVRHLQKLKVLNLSHNNFTGVPAEVGQLAELVVLNLSYNPITGLPHEIGNLKKLEVLDLRGTEYSTYDLSIIKEGLNPLTEILVD